MSIGKFAKDSETTMTELVLPNDTNTLNNLRGGMILHWMDVASAIAAGKHAQAVVVTASVDNVSFENPIRLGDVVTIKAKVTRAFRTSIETHIEVWAESWQTRKRYKSNEAYYTFVALDNDHKPIPTVPVIPETEEEKRQYDGAVRRRELRLVLAGRMKASEAHSIKELFS